MDVLEDFVPCGNCENGYILEGDSVKKCSCFVEYQEKGMLISKVRDANIPFFIDSESDKTIINYDLSDYKGVDSPKNLFKIERFISDFNKFKRRNLFFSGGFGTQKSTLLRYIGVQLLKQGYTVYYTLADSLIRELIEADRDEDLKNKWDKIINYDCILIDEMSEDKITTYKSGWQRTFLLPFLKKRMEIIRKSVVFASNSPIDDIGAYFEGAIQDIIYREVVDKTMIFSDNYHKLRQDIDPMDLWN